jgi:hypothetical protein
MQPKRGDVTETRAHVYSDQRPPLHSDLLLLNELSKEFDVTLAYEAEIMQGYTREAPL